MSLVDGLTYHGGSHNRKRDDEKIDVSRTISSKNARRIAQARRYPW
jgi:hypothetical protein